MKRSRKMKTCRDCRRDLPLENFSSHKGTADGFRPACKQCRADRRAGYDASASASAIGVNLADFDGSSDWWIGGCAAFAGEVARNPESRPLQGAAKVFASLAGAARPFMQRAELEDKVANLEELLSSFLDAADHGVTFVTAEDLEATEAARSDKKAN